MDEGASHKRLHRVTGLFQRGGQKVECCSKSTMCKQSEQTQILSPANTCCRLNMERAGTREEDPRRPNVLAPVAAAAHGAAARV